MNINVHTCFICGNRAIEFVKSNFDKYYICSTCKTSQLYHLPSAEELATLYNRFHLNVIEGGSYDWIEERMKADFPVKINLIKKIIGKPTFDLLDVGCGKGYFIKECINRHIDAIGIDVSASGIDYANNKLKVNAYQTDISKFAEQKENQNKYDVVTLWATIEHLPNPREVFSSIFKCLKPGGLFFLDTGLGNDRWEKYLCGYSQWYDAPQHLFVYSIQGLKFLLEKNGFAVARIDKNFERSYLRRMIKYLRHLYICISSFLVLRPVLGTKGFETMKKESKWPVGKLLQIIAKKPDE